MEKSKKENLLKQINILKALIGILKKLLALFQKKKEVEEEQRINLKELAEAMAHFEGFYRTDYETLAQKNHNPLNLRWSKFMTMQKGGFAFFENNEIGWKACLWDLCKKCKGETSTGLNSEKTLKDLIYIWSATDQEPYMNYVCQKLKVGADYKLKNFELNSHC